MKRLFTLAIGASLFACNQPSTNADTTTTTTTTTADKIDQNRANPKKEAIQTFEEKVPNDLNDWYFRVKLYETDKRFTYRMTLQYEEISAEDDITFPNLGMDPQPILKKGAKDNECIIGFNNENGEFKDYKKVHVVGGNLKVTTLKSYAVTLKE